MNRLLFACFTFLIMLISQVSCAANTDVNPANLGNLRERSVLSKGNTARLKNALKRARNGEDIVVGVIGGSITSGNSAKRVEDRWGNRVYQWWKNTFPNSRIKFVNAGAGGTGSNYGAHRVQRDLLRFKPDFIVAEFAVTDANNEFSAETLEGIVRQILKAPGNPALMLLFMTYHNGRSAQEWHSKVGRHYDLPMISYGDAIMTEIGEGRMKWADISSDIVHPNSRGHKYCAEFINAYLSSVMFSMTHTLLSHTQSIPEPLISDTFEHTSMYQSSEIEPAYNRGWHEFKGGWRALEPGSEMVFEVTGKVVSIMYQRVNGDMGQVEASVDDRAPVRLNGWFRGEYWYKEFAIIGKDLKPGKHSLQIKLTENKHRDSNGYRFEIVAILAAGLSGDQP